MKTKQQMIEDIDRVFETHKKIDNNTRKLLEDIKSELQKSIKEIYNLEAYTSILEETQCECEK